jgi:uncharacterized membrane protein
MTAAAAEEWALFFHLVAAFVLVGGVLLAGVAFELARRRSRPSDVALLLGVARVGVAFVGLGAPPVLAFGLWLVHLGRFGYGAGWVDASLGLFAAVTVVGALGGQRPKRARKLSARLAEAGEEESPELRALLDDPTAIALNYLAAALLVAIVALMVFKPGAP